MRCGDVRGRLDAYVEQELTADEAAGIRAHLDRCAVCRIEEARVRRALEPLRQPELKSMPASVAQGLYARLAAMPAPRQRRVGRLRLAGALASVLLLSVCFAVAWRPDASGPTNAPEYAGAPRATPSNAAMPDRDAKPDLEPPPRIAEEAALAMVREVRSGPDPDQPRAPMVRRIGRKRPVNPAPEVAFLDVADSRGITARELLQRRSAPAAPDQAEGAERRPLFLRPGRVEETLNERVRIGDQVTELHGEAEWDASGRLMAMRVRAETSEAVSDEASPDQER